MLSRRNIINGIGGAGLALLLGSQLVSAAAAADTVTLWSWRTDDQVAMRKMFDVFEAKNPDVKVDLQFTADADYQNRLSTALRGGKGPDIAQLKAYGELQPLVEAGYLDALNDTVPGIATMPATASGGAVAKSDGKFYGVPYSIPVLGVFYNTDIFDKNGIKVPTTYAEFLDACKKLKAAGLTPIANGGANGSAWELELGVGVIGPSVYGSDFYNLMMTGKAKFTDPKYVAALQRYKDLLPYYSDGFAGIDYTAATQQFVNGKAAMFFGGSWENGSFKAQNANLKFSIFAFPGDTPTDKPVVSAFSDGSYGLVDTSQHKEAALKVLNWMASPEFAQLFADDLGWPAARPDIKPSDAILTKMIAMQGNTTPYLTLVGYRWQAPTASSIIQAEIIDMVTGKITPEKLAADVDAGVSTWFQPTTAQ
jgi:raffinose/stachyose/melibiose transport system substrate-binding protein